MSAAGDWACPACGTRNAAGATECSSCGRWASVFELEEAPARPGEPPAERSWTTLEEAPAPAAETPAPPPPAPASRPGVVPQCPHCGAVFAAGDVLCRVCGKPTAPSAPATRQDVVIGRQWDLVFWVFLAAFVALMVIFAVTFLGGLL